MRNMSFSATTEQVRAQTKFVTRRPGWKFLKPGDRVRACVKCMGLKAGEKVEVICEIEIVSNRREPLARMIEDYSYGRAECVLEGFPPPHQKSHPATFVAFFCNFAGVDARDEISRIEFRYVVPNMLGKSL